MPRTALRVICTTAVLLFGAIGLTIGPATAEDCWTDVTPQGCSGGFFILQFKNNCSGGTRTVNVCLKYTSGPSTGNVNRLAGSASGGQVAEINTGACSLGEFSYRWRRDGGVPNCP